MNADLVPLLRSPRSGATLCLESPEYEGNRIRTAWLTTQTGDERYPIRDFIPRFVGVSNYADNFGMQWNLFRRTQLDSQSGQSISADRFWKATGWTKSDLEGNWVLDCGCGAGRFAEVALDAGAKVVALDYSSAVDACYANLGHYKNLYVIQGDIYALPLAAASFPFVYSLGVLQHTPDVGKAFAALPAMLVPSGALCADFYWRRIRTMLHMKYALRPFTTRMKQDTLLRYLQRAVPALLPLSQAFGRVPVIGKGLKRLIPVADYSGIYQLSPTQLEEWAVLDTFDMLAPTYDNPHSSGTVAEWFRASGLINIEVLHAGHLVGRGRKPG